MGITEILLFFPILIIDQQFFLNVELIFKKYICLTSVTRAKCGIRSTLCWKIPNISGSTELFAL